MEAARRRIAERPRYTAIQMTNPTLPARYIDTNVILRYLLDDDPVLSAQARVYIDGDMKNQTEVEMVAEAV